MNNYKIVIDPGHGGEDSGATGNGIIEKNLTLQISKYMYDLFNELGIPVVLTRTTDETVNPTERVNRILNAYGNNPNVIVISNHINAGGGDGAEIIYALRNTDELSNLVLGEIGKENQNIRRVYQRRLPYNPSQDYYFIHRNTGVTEPIIIEYGFLDSTGDDPSQLKRDYEKYAQAVVRGVLEYIGYDEASTGDYIVEPGDTLWNISKRFNITVDELKAANNLETNLLSVGQVLVIPNKQEEVEDQYITYIVKQGDNLYAIGRQYGLSPNELMEYNNLTSNLLSIGQTLRIPVTDTDITYIVKRGDTLYSLARTFNTTVDSIKNKNELTSNTLSIGQILKI